MGMSVCCRFVGATRFLMNLAKQKAPFGKIDDERKERPPREPKDKNLPLYGRNTGPQVALAFHRTHSIGPTLLIKNNLPETECLVRAYGLGRRVAFWV